MNEHQIVRRRQALAIGMTRYFTGKPCSVGHVSERYVSTRGCIQCLAMKQQNNASIHNARCRDWARRHPDRDAEAKRMWKIANPDRVREQGRKDRKKWQKRNPGKATAESRARDLSKKKRTPKWADLESVAKLYELASTMTRKTGEPWHVDHIIPLHGRTVSGLHVHGNLRVVRRFENLTKSNKWDDEQARAA